MWSADDCAFLFALAWITLRTLIVRVRFCSRMRQHFVNHTTSSTNKTRDNISEKLFAISEKVCSRDIKYSCFRRRAVQCEERLTACFFCLFNALCCRCMFGNINHINNATCTFDTMRLQDQNFSLFSKSTRQDRNISFLVK